MSKLEIALIIGWLPVFAFCGYTIGGWPVVIAVLLVTLCCFGAGLLVAWLGWVKVDGITPARRMGDKS